MDKDKQRITELKKRVALLSQELDETYRSVTELTNELTMANKERLKAEEKAQRIQKLESLGVMAGGIAHDFNNLLMVIMGYTELALEQVSSVSPARKSINKILETSRRAAELINQILAYSGSGTIEVAPVNINKILREPARQMEATASESVVIKYELNETIPKIEGNVRQIRQTIINMLTNALEAIGDTKGVITTSTGATECDNACLSKSYVEPKPASGPFVWLQVTDTGCGMNQETLTRFCEPFFTTKFTGRGLGMAAALGIIKGHRGAMLVESEVGKGTTIRILFPFFDRRAKPRGEQQLENVQEDRHSKGTALIVDDEEIVRKMTSLMLKKIGFNVIYAEGGREGISMLKKHENDIDLVLLDLSMPDMDGEETFYAMRRIKEDVFVILVSGYRESEIAQRFDGKGFAGFLHKPYTKAILHEKLMEVLLGC